MKPVEDVFSSDVFRRVVLPGIVLSAGFHPFISSWNPTLTGLYGIGPTTVVVAEIITFGLGVSSATQWIYYVYEGFRLEWVTSLAGRINRTRVERYQQQSREIQADRDFDSLTVSEQSKVTRIYEYLLDFPIAVEKDGSARHFAERPTRLGNIIATYESYAESRYGFDGTYFWYHFLNLAADANRKAFQDTYSFAESLVLASFAGAIVAILHLLALLGFAIGAIDRSLVFFTASSSAPLISGWLALLGFLVWLGFYQAALPAHRDAGAILRAIVDAVIPRFIEWARTLPVPPPDGTIKTVTAVNEYLKDLALPDVTPSSQSPHRNIRRRRRV